jgi:ribose transport system substrate-binding protein
MKSMIKGLSAVALAVAALGAMPVNAATVALVTINQQALFFNQINDGAQQAADKAGAKLVIFNANNNAAAQNSAIEDYNAHRSES